MPVRRLAKCPAAATIVWLLLLTAHPQAFPQPKLEIPGGFSFDFGDVYASDARRVLPIRNIGSDTLVISSVSASCGCTAALISKNHIPPGDTGFLSITFDARRFSGKVQKTVSMKSNDSAHAHVNIAFAANVIKTLMFDPEYFYFTADLDSPVTKTLVVTNASASPITILSLTPTTAAVTATMDKMTIQPSEEATITATFTAPSPGTHKGDIAILTDQSPSVVFNVRYFALAKASKASR